MKMSFASLLILALYPLATTADDRPAAGRFLVATADVDGSSFERTVILLLHYDEAGAQGLVINRRSDAELAEVFPGSESLADYQGALFWGGPVRIATMRALLRTDDPPAAAIKVIEDVYQVPLEDELGSYAGDEATLRYYLGYAGWAPGQLDRELRFGSWNVVAADADLVFASDPGSVWQRVRPTPAIRAMHDASGDRWPESALQVTMHDRGAYRVPPDVRRRAEAIEEPIHREQ